MRETMGMNLASVYGCPMSSMKILTGGTMVNGKFYGIIRTLKRGLRDGGCLHDLTHRSLRHARTEAQPSPDHGWRQRMERSSPVPSNTATTAPCERRNRTASGWPLFTATWKGVRPAVGGSSLRSLPTRWPRVALRHRPDRCQTRSSPDLLHRFQVVSKTSGHPLWHRGRTFALPTTTAPNPVGVGSNILTAANEVTRA